MSLVPMSYLPYPREGPPLPFQHTTSSSFQKKFEELIENLINESKCNAPPQSQPVLTARTFRREMEKLRQEILTAVKDAAGVNELKAEVKKLVEIMENHATSQSAAMQEIRERITQLQSDFQENNLLKWVEEDVNRDFPNNPGLLALPAAEPSTSSSMSIHSVVQTEDEDCIVVFEGRGTISKHCFLKSETSGSGSQQTVQENVEQQVDNAEAPTGDSGEEGTRASTPAGSVDMDNESEDDGGSSQASPESRNENVAECAGPTSNELEEPVKWVPGLTLRSRTIMVPSRPTGKLSRKRKRN